MSYEEIGNVWKQEGIDIDLSKLTVSQATYAFFKKAGLQTKPAGSSAYNDSNFYLANIKGIDKGTVKVQQHSWMHIRHVTMEMIWNWRRRQVQTLQNMITHHGPAG